MPKRGRAKKVVPEEEEEEDVEQSPQAPAKGKPIHKAPKGKNKITEQANDDVFSEGFHDRLAKFSSLNEEVLNLKAEIEGGDQTEELKARKEKVSSRIEDASSKILKSELESLEVWIGEQRGKISGEVDKINDCYEKNKANLEETGSFSEKEIKKNLESIASRASEK